MNIWSFLCAFVLLFGTTLRGQSDIPDSPNVLCVESKNISSIDDIYKLKGKGYWEAFNDDEYRLTLGTVNSTSVETWVVQHIFINGTKTITRTLFYCSDMPSDYDPEDDEQGDPQDCGEWTNNVNSKVESITMTQDTENCAAFDSTLSWLDGVILGYACLVVVILLFLMCPFSPFNKHCQRSRYEAAELEIYQKILVMRGINPQAQRSTGDKRTVDIAFLRHDLLRDKVVWHNDFYIDWFLFLRTEHPFLSLFYGHKLHPYSRNERRFAFIGLQFLAFGLAAYITSTIAEDNIGDPVVGFILGFMFDLLFGVIITAATDVFEYTATCEGADKKGKCARTLQKKCGHCGMVGVTICCVLYGILYPMSVFERIGVLYPNVNRSAVSFIFLVNYFSGLALGWFLLDIIFDRSQFKREWLRQRGEEPPKGCCSNCSIWCFSSWACLWCCIYYKFCRKEEPKLENYPKDANGNTIGSEDGAFAVSYLDYEAYKKQAALPPRNLDDVIAKIGLKTARDVLFSVSTSPGGGNNLNTQMELKVQTEGGETFQE